MTTLFDIKAHKGDIGGSICTPYKFNGKERDDETGYYYYGARYYDPGTALWFGTDPLAMKNPEVGAYVFCRGNPIVRIDPDGKDDYGLDQESGRLSLLKKTDSDYDIINAGRFDSNNSFIKNNDINSMSVSKGILDGEYFDDISKSGLVVRDNISEGIELVKYISFNTGKELNGWGYESGDEYGIAVSPWSQNRLYKDARGFHNTSVDYYYKGDDRVGYLGVKLLKFHTHPIIKDLVNSGKAIPSNADIENCDPKFPHYIISQRDNCMIQYKKDKSWSRSGIVIK